MNKLAITLLSFCLTGLVAAQAGTSTYLGVGTSEVDPALAEHIGLPPGIGLRVDHVDAEGAVGDTVNVNDVLHKLNDQLLVNHQQLSISVRLPREQYWQ